MSRKKRSSKASSERAAKRAASAQSVAIASTGMWWPIRKQHVFFAIVMALMFVTLVATIHVDMIKPVKMTLYKQNGHIANLSMTRDISSTTTFMVSRISIPTKQELNIEGARPGFSNDFFVDFETFMQIDRDGWYVFDVYSDDGFSLSIDGIVVSAFVKDRAYAKTNASYYLTAGEHKVVVHYFQGYGPFGLDAYYARAGESARYLIGDDSTYVSFSATR